jgi:PAS domain S-box-containing protein
MKKSSQSGNKFFGKIGNKINLILFLIALIIVGGGSTVFYFQSLQSTDGAVIDASGRDRMLSQRVGFYAEQVFRGDEDAKAELRSIVDLHDTSFYALKDGGVAPDISNNRLLPPTIPSIMPKVLYAEELWIEYKKNADIIINESTFIDGEVNPTVALAMLFIEQSGPDMLDRNNEMVKAYVVMNDNKQITLNYAIHAIVLIGGFLLLLSAYIIRNFVAQIVKLTTMARALHGGKLLTRTNLKSNDELGIFSNAFNAMADSILDSRLDLESKVDERTKKLDKNKSNLERQRKAVLNILEDAEDERDNVTEEKNKIDAILHSIGDGVFVLDSQFNIFMFNEAASSISGFGRDKILGNVYDEVLKFVYEKDGTGRSSFIRESVIRNEVVQLPLYSALVRKDNELVAVSAIASPLRDKGNNVIGCVVVFHDISKEREIDKSKSEFVSLASHQLRTPLSTINWYVEMLLEENTGKLKKEQKKFLDEIYKGSKRMVNLVNALLNVSRLELGTFAVEPELSDISKIAKDAIAELAALLEEKGVKILEKYDNLPEINLDRKLTHIVFQNLLSNAVKYSPKGSVVRLNISNNKHDMFIEVADEGLGIPKDQQNKIFTKLFRANNVKEVDTTGTGLGLYIVKSILDHSSGKISFESEEGKGSVFRVAIPLKGMVKKEGKKALS